MLRIQQKDNKTLWGKIKMNKSKKIKPSNLFKSSRMSIYKRRVEEMFLSRIKQKGQTVARI